MTKRQAHKRKKKVSKETKTMNETLDMAIVAIKKLQAQGNGATLSHEEVGALFGAVVGICTPTADMDLFQKQEAFTRLNVLHAGVSDARDGLLKAISTAGADDDRTET